MPAAGASTVACLADAVAPAVPTVLDNCGSPLTVSEHLCSVLILCAPVRRLIRSPLLCVITQPNSGYILIPSVRPVLPCLRVVLLR